MKTIIAATDFSPAATNAVNYAADMASAIHADLILVHIAQIPIGYGEIVMSVDVNGIQQLAAEKMNKTIKDLEERSALKISITTELRMGSFSHELKLICEKAEPYAVVMGSQGTTAAERFLMGSHTVYAMKHLAWPLIAVPPTSGFTSINKIALACDFDNTNSIQLDEIKVLVKDFHAELHIINTGRKDLHNPMVTFKAGWLEIALAPVKPTYHFIANENTDNAIMHFAETNHIDMLIVLPRRHGILERLTRKSHTTQIVLHAHVPVMALHM